MLDTSGSMRGEPIEAVNMGIRVMISALRQDPHSLETVNVSMITFDTVARVVLPLTALDELVIPEIVTPQSGATHLGMALQTLEEQILLEIRRSTPERKGDWAPLLFVMTDGKPSDTFLFEQMCPRIRSLGFANIIGCVAGPRARKEDLQALCDHVIALDTLDSAGFISFFTWVTSAVSGGSRSMGTATSLVLPPPPPEIQMIY
ncbi:MAG: VWA domain-containing protein [Magnetococcus sp. YQC-9]